MAVRIRCQNHVRCDDTNWQRRTDPMHESTPNPKMTSSDALSIVPISELPGLLTERDHGGYFAESVRCFGADAYRSAILMVYNAVHSRLWLEISELAVVGIPRAAAALEAINKAAAGNESFEGRIVSFFKDLFEPEQKAFISDLGAVRNKLSHPTARETQAVEAERYLRKAVDLFLGFERVSKKLALQFLVIDLQRPDYFDDLAEDTVVRTVVSEIGDMSDKELAELANELINVAETPGRREAELKAWQSSDTPDKKKEPEKVTSADKTAAVNAGEFLVGMLLTKDLRQPAAEISRDRIRKRTISERQIRNLNPATHRYLIGLIPVFPQIVSENSGDIRGRVIALCCKHFGQLETLPEASTSGHPLEVLDALSTSSDPDGSGFNIDELQPLITVCMERFWQDASVAFWLVENGHAAKLFLHFAQSIVYADEVQDETIAKLLRRFDRQFATSVETVELVRMLWLATDAPDGGKVSEMWKAGFQAIPSIRAAARSYVKEHAPGDLVELRLQDEPVPTAYHPGSFHNRRKSQGRKL